MHTAPRAHRWLMGTPRLFCLLNKRLRFGKPCAMTRDRGHPDGQASLCPSYRINVNSTT